MSRWLKRPLDEHNARQPTKDWVKYQEVGKVPSLYVSTGKSFNPLVRVRKITSIK